MSRYVNKLAERIRRWLPYWLPWLSIGLAWRQMTLTQLAQAAGSGG